MLDPRLQVIISAVDNASKIFKQIQGNVKQMQGDMQKYGKQMTATGKKMTTGLTLPIIGMGAVAVKSAADFDKSMTESIAIMKTTAKQEKEMEKVAREVAKSMATSHEEAARGYFYLASAGLGANEAIAAMPRRKREGRA